MNMEMKKMNKKHIITIAGNIASGKSIVTDLLVKELGYELYRNGTYFRNLAEEHNMSIKDFNIYVESHPDIDIEIEKSAEQYAKEHDNLIIDARLGWYVVPESFKIYLTVDIDEASKRVFYDIKRGSIDKYETIEHAKEDIIARHNSEKMRYSKLYNVNNTDMSNYDLVIDTTNVSAEVVIEQILKEYKKWLED